MNIFVHTKVVSPLEFRCNSNELIFSPISRELDELCEFYKIFPEMEVFRAVPSVLQTAVMKTVELTYYSQSPGNLLCGHLLKEKF